MKISNRKIIENMAILGDISRKQLPVKASYAIAKNIGKLESELKDYDKQRQKLLDQYAEKDKKGERIIENGQVKFTDENKEKFQKDINELLDIKADVDIHKFKFSEIENCSFSAAELRAIDYMIEE